MEIGDVGELTAEPIERFADHNVEAVAVDVGEQLLVLRAIAAGAADRAVGIDLDKAPSLAVEQPTADLELVVDRCLALQVARITGVDDGAHPWNSRLSGTPTLIQLL